MWFIFVVAAIIATALNIILYFVGNNYKFMMAMGLALTALTLCAEYSQVSNWVKKEDWGALSDVIPTMEYSLWFLTIVSILLNFLPILFEIKNKKDA